MSRIPMQPFTSNLHFSAARKKTQSHSPGKPANLQASTTGRMPLVSSLHFSGIRFGASPESEQKLAQALQVISPFQTAMKEKRLHILEPVSAGSISVGRIQIQPGEKQPTQKPQTWFIQEYKDNFDRGSNYDLHISMRRLPEDNPQKFNNPLEVIDIKLDGRRKGEYTFKYNPQPETEHDPIVDLLGGAKSKAELKAMLAAEQAKEEKYQEERMELMSQKIDGKITMDELKTAIYNLDVEYGKIQLPKPGQIDMNHTDDPQGQFFNTFGTFYKTLKAGGFRTETEPDFF